MPRLSKAFAVSFYSTTLLINMAVIVLLAGIASGWWIKKTDAVDLASVFAAAHHTLKKEAKSGVPTSLSLPSIGLDLPVKHGAYHPDGSWTLDDSNAFFALPSVPANNQKGTTLIYGHNTKPVFKNLNALTPGAELLVTTDNNLLFRYEYSFVTDVEPDNTSIFNTTNAPNITLQTCSGPWDALRSMYTFNFKAVEKL